MPPMPEEIYRQEDAQQILKLAIARQAEEGELSRTQLFEIAAELNIAPADIQAAELDWIANKGVLQEQESFNLYRRTKFQRGFTKYLIINGFLIALDLLTGGGVGWSLYVVLGWGLGVALDAWKTYQTSGDDYDIAFQRWRQTRQLKKSVNGLVNKVLGV
jgi:2TM domain